MLLESLLFLISITFSYISFSEYFFQFPVLIVYLLFSWKFLVSSMNVLFKYPNFSSLLLSQSLQIIISYRYHLLLKSHMVFCEVRRLHFLELVSLHSYFETHILLYFSLILIIIKMVSETRKPSYLKNYHKLLGHILLK